MRTVDLFAGCGGLSLGFQNAGFNLVAAFENWLPAIEVYRSNFEHQVIECDLSNIKSREIIQSFNPEMIIGGPPCQDFSSAGKRNENLGRGDLTLEFANLILDIKPNWFVMENVERIIKSHILQDAIKLFKTNKYGLTSVVLNASYYGVPQNRKRYFLIGELNGKNNSLEYLLNQKLLKSPMTVYDYLGNSLGIEHYYRHPRSYKRRGVFSIHEPSPTVRGVNRPIPKTYQKHKGDSCDITNNVRPLTTIERSYIQTFPQSFNFKGSKTNLEQMIGNAVPVKLAEYVADCIFKYVNQKNQYDNYSDKLQLKLF